MPTTYDVKDLLLVALAALTVGALLAGWAMNRYLERYWKKYVQDLSYRHDLKYTRETARLNQEIGNAREQYRMEHEEVRRLGATFDYRVEKEVEKRIREWTPDQMTADEEFARADYMAKHRRTLDAGRSHPPRDDGGEPARVHQLTLKR